jgi:isoquinoline 1-oxidoreductase beta subunit
MTALDAPIGRRKLLQGFLVAGPTLVIAARLGLDGSHPNTADAAIPGSPELHERQDLTDFLILTAQPFYYDLLVEIKPDNRVYFEIPRMDVGTGCMTAITMMMADNLDVPMENFDVALSKAEPRRGPGQLTGGSHAVRSLWDPVRIIAAQIKAQLKSAASDHWGISPGALRTENGHVVSRDGRRLSYGELTAAAAKITAPKEAPRLKKPEDYKLIGTPRSRMNALDIATGKAQYAMDLPVEGALPTVIAMSATAGATVVSVDDSEARKIPGVIAVTQFPGMPEMFIPGGVAVTAETFGIAKKAKNALKIQWGAGPMDNLSDPQIDELLKGIQDKTVTPDSDEGTVDATFRWPYVNHAPMETNTAVGHVTGDKAEIWSGLQIPNTAVRNIAQVLGMKEEQVVIHIMPRGGAFGRYLFHDAALQVAQISQRVGKPIRLMWLREEDLKHGRNRPASVHHVKATIRGGQVATWEHRMACPEMDVRHGLGDALSHQVVTHNNEGTDQFIFDETAASHLPYNVGWKSITLQQHLLAVASGAWRVVYSGQVCALNEIILDELARMLHRDEYEFRRELLVSDKHRAVLDKVAHEGQWGRKLPAGVAQGIGFHQEYHSIAAYLMEIDVRGKEPRLRNCTIAVDVGHCVNPKGTAAGLMSAAHDGFGVVFRAALHVDNGAIRESNWHEYRWTRIYDSAPEMSVHILPNTQAEPGGIGELGVPAASAAAANAWARATGKQPRNFPINEYGA